MTKPFKEKDIIQPLNDNYSLLIRFLFSDEMNIFMNSNIVTNRDNSVHVKNVGWVQFNYEDEVSKPSLSYSLDLSIPHPKSNQEVVLIGLKALSLWQSNVEAIKDVPFKDLKEGIEKIKHNF